MNHLEQYFESNNKNLMHKWTHYFEAYDRHFSKYRGQEIVVLEIGVSQGGSLQMWRDYFGPKAKIYGLDMEPNCITLANENTEILIGSQSDRTFLQDLKSKIPPIDILIDDGGHTMEQQIVTFEELYNHVKADGVYLVEDLNTSYWLLYGGGHQRPGTFIEYSKHFIDAINAWFSEETSLKVSGFTKTVHSLHYYTGILVIEKQPRKEPISLKTGNIVFERTKFPDTLARKIRNRLLKPSYRLLNKVLRSFGLPSTKWGLFGMDD
jgi:hypothetical protein